MKILNFGSLNMDYVYSVGHMTMEGETQTSQGMHIVCGGKGLNQSIALARAGARIFHESAFIGSSEPMPIGFPVWADGTPCR